MGRGERWRGEDVVRAGDVGTVFLMVTWWITSFMGCIPWIPHAFMVYSQEQSSKMSFSYRGM